MNMYNAYKNKISKYNTDMNNCMGILIACLGNNLLIISNIVIRKISMWGEQEEAITLGFSAHDQTEQGFPQEQLDDEQCERKEVGQVPKWEVICHGFDNLANKIHRAFKKIKQHFKDMKNCDIVRDKDCNYLRQQGYTQKIVYQELFWKKRSKQIERMIRLIQTWTHITSLGFEKIFDDIKQNQINYQKLKKKISLGYNL